MQPLLTGLLPIPLLFTESRMCLFTCQSALYGSPEVKGQVLKPLFISWLLHSVGKRFRCLENMFKGVRCDLDKIHPMGFDVLLSVVAMRMHLGNPTIRDPINQECWSECSKFHHTLARRPHFLHPAPSQAGRHGRERVAGPLLRGTGFLFRRKIV